MTTKTLSGCATKRLLMPIEQVIEILAQHLLRAPVSGRGLRGVLFECLLKDPGNLVPILDSLDFAFKTLPAKKPLLKLVKK